MVKILIFFIKIYQKTLSPDHGLLKYKYPYGFCRFYPSCSTYMIQSLQSYGLFKGLPKGFIRIIKCNPFAQPKIDKI